MNNADTIKDTMNNAMQ